MNRDDNYNYRSEIRGIMTGNWATMVGLSFTTHESGSQVERMRIRHDGKIGIGTSDPKAALDVANTINNGKLGVVLGRLNEGNTTDEGTFLGVRGYETQFNNYSGKSFALVHSFYGQENSSINFYRGASYTGGYMTFATSNNTERVRITHNGRVGIGTPTPTRPL